MQSVDERRLLMEPPSFRDGALAPDPESRDSGLDASHRPEMTAETCGYGSLLSQGRRETRSNGMIDRNWQLCRLFLPECRKRLPGQRRQHQRDHVIEALVPRLLAEEIAAENHAQGGAVRQIKETQRGDRNIKLYRVDCDDKVAARNASAHHGTDHFDERRVHRLDLGRTLEMARLGEVFGVEQRQKLGIPQEIIPGEVDQALDRVRRIEVFEIEGALLDP